jgi:hypothetical protein
MDVVGLPTEAQMRRMQGIIAMLQADKKELEGRLSLSESNNATSRAAAGKLARQAEEAQARADSLLAEKNELQAEMQVSSAREYGPAPFRGGGKR